MLTMLLTILSCVYVFGLALCARALTTSPIGYEDESGFRLGIRNLPEAEEGGDSTVDVRGK